MAVVRRRAVTALVVLGVAHLVLPAHWRAAPIAVASGVLVLVVRAALVARRPAAALPWWLLAAASATSAAGIALALAVNDTTMGLPVPSHVLIGASQLLAILGFGAFVRPRTAGLDRDQVLDLAVVLVSAVTVMKLLVLDPTGAAASPEGIPVGLSEFYVLNVVVAFGVLIRLATLPGSRPPALWYLIGGIAVVVVVSSLPSGELAMGLTNMAAGAFTILAVAHPSMRDLTEPIDALPRLSTTRVVGVGLALAVGPVTAVVAAARTDEIDPLWSLVPAALLTALVVARLALLFGQVQRAQHELEAAERELRHQATHDPLTGLANRALLRDRLEAACAAGRVVAVLFVDLDDFKAVNDRLGHGVGDELLGAAAGRLVGAVRASDLVARLGGDEFAVLVEEPEEPGIPEVLARRVLAALHEPIAAGGHRLAVRASIGVAAGAGLDPDELLRRADAAMYRVKQTGKDAVSVCPVAPPPPASPLASLR